MPEMMQEYYDIPKVSTKTSLRILHVVNAYPPAWEYGGPARVAYALAQSQMKQGHQISVYTTDLFLAPSMRSESPSFNMESIETGVHVHRFKSGMKPMAERLLFPIPKQVHRLRRQEIERFDIVHLHELRTPLNAWLWWWCQRLKIPYVIEPHGAAGDNGQWATIKSVFDRAVGQRILRDATALIALTDAERRELLDLTHRDSAVTQLPNGVDQPIVFSAEERNALRAEWRTTPGDLVILYLGRLAATKGIDLLVNAFAEISRTETSAKLVICGPDFGVKCDLLGQVNALGIADQVTFADPVFGDDRHRVFQAADVVAVPLFQGFPLVILEAMANGRPVLTAMPVDQPLISTTNILSTSKDARSLADGLRRLVGDEAFRCQVGQAAQRTIGQHLNWSLLTHQYIECYRQAIIQHGARSLRGQ